VNITLIFAVEKYEKVMDAYLTGLERRVAQHQPINHIASVASFFVSRVDTLAEKLLDEHAKGVSAGSVQERHHLEGKVAIANAKVLPVTPVTPLPPEHHQATRREPRDVLTDRRLPASFDAIPAVADDCALKR
jgi:hypothetical protein